MAVELKLRRILPRLVNLYDVTTDNTTQNLVNLSQGGYTGRLYTAIGHKPCLEFVRGAEGSTVHLFTVWGRIVLS
jgi:hypothetical protein